jgi:dienelactone hydrolase
LAEVLLFHHAQGLTAGVRSFADRLRSAGHVVHVPDLYDGKTFAAIDDGVGYAKEVGFGQIGERGKRAAADLPKEIVYAGISLGVLSAQMLAQTRPGAKGALLEKDEWVLEGDLDAAREIAASVKTAELFLYPGDRHLFMDDSLPDFDKSAASTLKQRVLSVLARMT